MQLFRQGYDITWRLQPLSSGLCVDTAMATSQWAGRCAAVTRAPRLNFQYVHSPRISRARNLSDDWKKSVKSYSSLFSLGEWHHRVVDSQICMCRDEPPHKL